GYDTVDVLACTAAGVLVVNQSGANAEAVAEHALAMMLSLAKKIPQTDRSLRSGAGVSRERFKGLNAEGRTVGVIGIGKHGAALCSPVRAGAADESARLRSLSQRGGDPEARRDQGGSRDPARPIALRLDPLPVRRGDAEHDRRARARRDAARVLP